MARAKFSVYFPLDFANESPFQWLFTGAGLWFIGLGQSLAST